MARRLLWAFLVVGLVIGCSDEGPRLPILFVSAPDGSTGGGSITSSPPGINCGISGTNIFGTCSANFDDGTQVTLTASPGSGSAFSEWGDDCTGAALTCAVMLDDDADVTAGFETTTPPAPGPSLSLAGFMASTDDATSGLIVVSIPVASAVVAGKPRTDGSQQRLPGPNFSFAGPENAVVATGTMTYVGSEPFAVAGVYDTLDNQLRVTSSDGFEMNASFDGEVFDGSFEDPARDAFGEATLIPGSGDEAPTAFCGTYVSDSEFSDSGSWNVVVTGTLVTGFSASNQQEGAIELRGELLDGTMTLEIQDDSEGSSATGTLSTDGTTLTGTFERLDFSGLPFITGTWTASTEGCAASS